LITALICVAILQIRVDFVHDFATGDPHVSFVAHAVVWRSAVAIFAWWITYGFIAVFSAVPVTAFYHSDHRGPGIDAAIWVFAEKHVLQVVRIFANSGFFHI
jgi:hypothetical protein